jgi:hypothetical protein
MLFAVTPCMSGKPDAANPSVGPLDLYALTLDETHAAIRTKVLERFGKAHDADDPACSQGRLASTSDDIRNALQTIASLLQEHPNAKSRRWCASVLRREVKHILDILERLSS